MIDEYQNTIIHWLEAADAYDEAKRIRDCCSNPIIYFNPSSKSVKLQPKRCNSRWCPVCSRIQREETIDRLERLIKHYGRERLRFCTLTQVAKKGESLEHVGERFRKSLHRLVRTRWWKNRVQGYYLKYEIDWNPVDNWWHYHAHFLLHTRWLAREKLQEKWSKVSPGALMVDVKPIRPYTTFELSKYVTKMKYRGFIPLRELTEYCSTHRMSVVSGNVKKYWRTTEPEKTPTGFEFYGSIHTLIRAIHERCYTEVDYFVALHVHKYKDDVPYINDIINDEIEDFIIRFQIDRMLAKAA